MMLGAHLFGQRIVNIQMGYQTVLTQLGEASEPQVRPSVELEYSHC